MNATEMRRLADEANKPYTLEQVLECCTRAAKCGSYYCFFEDRDVPQDVLEQLTAKGFRWTPSGSAGFAVRLSWCPDNG